MSNQYERLDAPDPVDQAAELAQMQLNIALQNQKNSRRTLLPKLAEMKKVYPKAINLGSIFQGGKMIFVTVGTHEQPFNRLVKKVDDLVAHGNIKEKVIIQTGFSTYNANRCECFS